MSDLVNVGEIEQIVGVERHPSEHYGRAVSAEQTVYILHSQECKDSGVDLRECPFSVALDRGIEHFYPWTGWRRVQDRPVRLEISRGFLMPEFAAYRGGGPMTDQDRDKLVMHLGRRGEAYRPIGDVLGGGFEIRSGGEWVGITDFDDTRAPIILDLGDGKSTIVWPGSEIMSRPKAKEDR